MIYEFSEFTKDYIKTNKTDKSIPLVLDNIATMIRKGDNILKIDIETIDYIVNKIDVREDSKMTYLGYKKTLRYYDQISTINYFTVVICINFKIVNLLKKDKYIFELPYDYVKNSHYLSKPKLICEDYYDIDFITELSKLLFIKNEGIRINTSFAPIHGGGLRTGETLYRHAISDDQFCFVIADSDIKAPYSSFGDTLGGIKENDKLLKSSSLSNYYIEELDVHEIENIIPFYFLEKIYGSEKECVDRILKLKKLICKDLEYRKYFDFKNGINFELIRHESNLNPIKTFWTEAAKEIDEYYHYTHLFGNKENDGKSILYGYRDYLKKSIKIIKDDFNKILDIIELNEFETEKWNNLSVIVNSICCSTQKMRC